MGKVTPPMFDQVRFTLDNYGRICQGFLIYLQTTSLLFLMIRREGDEFFRFSDTGKYGSIFSISLARGFLMRSILSFLTNGQGLIKKLKEILHSKPEVNQDMCWIYLERLDRYSKVGRVWFQDSGIRGGGFF